MNKNNNQSKSRYPVLWVWIASPFIAVRFVWKYNNKLRLKNSQKRILRISDTPSSDTLIKTDSITTESKPISYMTSQAVRAEMDVDTALRGLKEKRYFVFKDLILPTDYKELSLAQIDHVVVSHYGVFCVETKSHKGLVTGLTRSDNWKQYLGHATYPVYSPFKQNKHHVRSLELLLKDYLKAPVHSYAAFPYAKKVVVDSIIEDMSPTGVVSKINRHTKPVYDDADVERIAKTLAHAATYRESLRGRHINDVRMYVERKTLGTLKLS